MLFEGRVIDTIQELEGRATDGNCYAIVWDVDRSVPFKCFLGTISGSIRSYCAQKDATPEVRIKYRAWRENTGCISIEEQEQKIAKQKKAEARADRERQANESAQTMKPQSEDILQLQQQQWRTAQKRTIQMRKASGQCMMCGLRLGFLNKLLRRNRHPRCLLFKV